MEDKGKKLFEMYKANLSRLGIEMDGWNDLEETDRNAWRWTADEILAGRL